MKTFKYLSFLFLVFVITISANQSTSLDQKVNHLVEVLDSPTQEQIDELYIISQFIEDNWDIWTKDPQIVNNYSYLKFQPTKESWIAVHPNVPEVLIFLKGHAISLGKGVVKQAIRGLSYKAEGEIAMAIPHSMLDKDSIRKVSGDFINSDKTEVEMLEKVQGAYGVMELKFAAYHWAEESSEFLPIIISKYYNGGDFRSFRDDGKPATLEEQLTIYHDITRGVVELQAREISHNDLHAGNVLIEKNTKSDLVVGAVIIDFGLAKKTDPSALLYNGDTKYMYYHITRLLKSKGSGDTALGQYSEMAEENKIQASIVYAEFLTLLPLMVDEETANRILKINLKKGLKKAHKYDNVIIWN